ncbi:MAG TPA: CHASE4 domain-containing protein [Steroidobacteraceae bacterium]|nr:CHASE4 domain-containing protein [Steroidobacteraceae bacterium]
MKIRPKVVALIASVCTILVAAEVVVQRSVVMPSFTKLERSDARTVMRRVTYAFDMTLDRIDVSASDWGDWADIYRFMQDHDLTHVTGNFTPAAIKEINIDLVMIADPNGNIVYSNATDLKTGQTLSLAFAGRSALPADFPWRRHLGDSGVLKGLLRTEHGVLLLAGAPILDGNGHGPARGMLLMGRFLRAAEVAQIGAQAQASVAMLPVRAGEARDQLIQSNELTHVYRTFNDVYGRPVMALRVDVPRQISRYGHTALVYASTCLAIAGGVLLALLLVVLNRVVLTPLAVVTRHAVAIGRDADLTARLELNKQDEFGVLANEFNGMVARLSESRRQLVDQSFEAGFGELAKGVLHNLGNAMTPIGVRLSSLQERLREAPVQDAEQAVAELEAGSVDLQREAQLKEFVRLACRELARTLGTVEQEVAVMSRQTKVVQSVLAEQLRSARTQHVIEPVRLPELVSDALDMVSDAARQRLRIEIDESLKSLGSLLLARTVLRLVLQNVIINAADAIRAAGRDRGMLRFVAEIKREMNRALLHLRCWDDGVGIPEENIERIFEKGFSTKSRETNCGIGLHWCANALNALGGRIWASSDGNGHGATMHILMPVNACETSIVSLAGAA